MEEVRNYKLKLKEEYPEFFKQFSEEFLDFVFSEELISTITQICLESGIENEEKIEKIAYRITLALFNQIPKENLAQVLVNGVGLNLETARKISFLCEKLIFSKILKKTEISKEKFEIKKDEKKEGSVPYQKDIYREPIE
jgi:hypothetical protein